MLAKNTVYAREYYVPILVFFYLVLWINISVFFLSISTCQEAENGVISISHYQ